MSKRILATILAITMIFGLAFVLTGCGGEATPDAPTANDDAPPTNIVDNVEPEEPEEVEATPITLGETITLEFVEFTIERAEWTERIEPPNAGRASIRGNEGYIFLALHGRAANTSTDLFDLSEMNIDLVINDQLSYRGSFRLVTPGGDGFTSRGGTPPLSERGFVLYFRVPNNARELFEEGRVTFGFQDNFVWMGIHDRPDHVFTLTVA